MEKSQIMVEGWKIADDRGWESLQEKYKGSDLRLFVMEKEEDKYFPGVVCCGGYIHLSDALSELASAYREYLGDLARHNKIELVTSSQIKHRDELLNNLIDGDELLNYLIEGSDSERITLKEEIIAVINTRGGKIPLLSTKEAGYYVNGILCVSWEDIWKSGSYSYTVLSRTFFLYAILRNSY